MYEEIMLVLREVRQDRSEYISGEDWALQVEALEGALAAFQRIWEICHEPTGREPALRHFQRDFDEIRALVKPFIKPEEA